MARAIGIDLGTTYTVVATVQDGRARIIPNAEGERLTPSVVAFTAEGHALVGQPAKRQAAANPTRTVFSIKRRMGSGYKARVADEEHTPEEISSLILRKVKNDAENSLGERIHEAVITVPAYFNNCQREATVEASLLAGLDDVRLINEPTAAALAYGLDREDAHTVMVWDLGGGTFDISILELGDGIFEVRAVSGDSWLGGDDFDERAMEYLTREYERLSGSGFPRDPVARQMLREAAEAMKTALSSTLVASVHLPPLNGLASELGLRMTRKQLESLTADLRERMVGCTQQALGDAGLTPEDIDVVILAGGATRMPAVRGSVRKAIGKEPCRYIDPDEVVAAGAAIHSGMLTGVIDRAVLLDVLPLSLGVETQGALTATIISRNTPLPASGSRLFTTAADYQTAMDIHVLQGERALAADNVSLGQFQLAGIPSALRGTPKVEVAFQADVDGIIHISATELLSESEVKVKIASTRQLDRSEIHHLAEEALRNVELDRQERDRIEAGIQAESLIGAAERFLNDQAGQLTDLQREEIAQACSRLRDARARGVTEAIKARSTELREVVAAAPKDSRGAAGPVVPAQGVSPTTIAASASP